MTIPERIAWRKRLIVESNTEIEFFEKFGLQLKGLPNPNIVGSDRLDFDRANRAETLEIIKRFPGKWDKTVEGTEMHYTLRLEKPILGQIRLVRIYGGTPPPCCHIVETIEDVPATTRVVRRLVCDDEEAEHEKVSS